MISVQGLTLTYPRRAKPAVQGLAFEVEHAENDAGAPGYKLAPSQVEHLETSFVGQGLHFIQEDQPEAIGRAIADWLRRIQ